MKENPISLHKDLSNICYKLEDEYCPLSAPLWVMKVLQQPQEQQRLWILYEEKSSFLEGERSQWRGFGLTHSNDDAWRADFEMLHIDDAWEARICFEKQNTSSTHQPTVDSNGG